MQGLHEPGVGVVYDLAAADVEGGYLGISSSVRRKSQMSRFCSMRSLCTDLGDDRHTALGVPAQGHLAGALAVLFADFGQHRVSEYAVPALGEGCPGLRLYAVLAHEGEGVLLLEKGVQLYLVYHGHVVNGLAEISQAMRVEVAHADGAD